MYGAPNCKRPDFTEKCPCTRVVYLGGSKGGTCTAAALTSRHQDSAIVEKCRCMFGPCGSHAAGWGKGTVSAGRRIENFCCVKRGRIIGSVVLSSRNQHF